MCGCGTCCLGCWSGSKKGRGSNQAKAIGAHDSGKSRSWRCELGPNTLHSPLCASG
ncbi:hypothetical protein HanPSC8_Chr09g0352801 [Helianthus annuus]|nr:hypothetical protein HanPSC8_Chr09g0352801 [Helianthus annuus]